MAKNIFLAEVTFKIKIKQFILLNTVDYISIIKSWKYYLYDHTFVTSDMYDLQ